MTPAATELLNAALALPEPDRSDLVEALEMSLHPPPRGLHPAWGPELRRRVADLDSGKSKCIPLEEFLRAVDEQLAAGSVTRG